MPQARMTGHQRQAIAAEIRHRYDGGDPQNFTDYSYKQLKELLRDAPGQPVLVSAGPRGKDGPN